MRDILVGKVPDPKSSSGANHHRHLSINSCMTWMKKRWRGVFLHSLLVIMRNTKNLLDAKLGGAEKVQLYSQAIENMYTNPTAPPLFRDIFKNSFLPFKDPRH